MFGGKGRVVTCEMVVCRGFDVMSPVRVEFHYIVAVSVSACAIVTNYIFNAHIYTHTRIRTKHARAHVRTHIYKLRLFIIL